MENNNILIGIDEENKKTSDMLKFIDAKDALIRGIKITDKDIKNINKLINLESITFENCIFDTEDYINLNIESANFYLCQDLYTQMLYPNKKLKTLVIRNCSNVNLEGISDLISIKKLYLQKQLGVDFSYIYNTSLEYLNLDGSNVFNMEEKEYPFKISRKEISVL